jgi:hypothetical protein
MGDNLLGDLMVIGTTLYVVDKVTGKKKKVGTANRKLIAENKALKRKLAKKRVTRKKKR